MLYLKETGEGSLNKQNHKITELKNIEEELKK